MKKKVLCLITTLACTMGIAGTAMAAEQTGGQKEPAGVRKQNQSLVSGENGTGERSLLNLGFQGLGIGNWGSNNWNSGNGGSGSWGSGNWGSGNWGSGSWGSGSWGSGGDSDQEGSGSGDSDDEDFGSGTSNGWSSAWDSWKDYWGSWGGGSQSKPDEGEDEEPDQGDQKEYAVPENLRSEFRHKNGVYIYTDDHLDIQFDDTEGAVSYEIMIGTDDTFEESKTYKRTSSYLYIYSGGEDEFVSSCMNGYQVKVRANYEDGDSEWSELDTVSCNSLHFMD